jgi:hypothetical protein
MSLEKSIDRLLRQPNGEEWLKKIETALIEQRNKEKVDKSSNV